MASVSAVLSLVLALQPAVSAAAGCTPTGTHNCNETGCCEEAGMKCFAKNPEWATCRAECKPGPHYNEPPFNSDKWSCIELTFGCNHAFRQCGGAGFTGPTCCDYGCACNQTNDDYHQCMPIKENVDYCNKPYPTTTTEAPEAAAEDAEPTAEGGKRAKRAIAVASPDEEEDVDLDDLELDPLEAALEAGGKYDVAEGDIEVPVSSGLESAARAFLPQILAGLSVVVALASAALALSSRRRRRECRAVTDPILADEGGASAEAAEIE